MPTQTWFDLAVPVVDKYKLLTTSFMITAVPHRTRRRNPYVLQRSHTHDMHQAGADGQGPHRQLDRCPRSSPTWRRLPPLSA